MKKLSLVCLAVMGVLGNAQAEVAYTQSYSSPTGNLIFDLDVHAAGSATGLEDASAATSDMEVPKEWVQGLSDSMAYWQRILSPALTGDTQRHVRINVYGFDREDSNAFCGSDPTENGLTKMLNAVYTSVSEATGTVGFNSLTPGDAVSDVPVGIIPSNTGKPISQSATMLHEFGHGFGIQSTAEQDEEGLFRFNPERISAFDKGLRDIYGHSAQPGMAISVEGEEREGDFVVSDKTANSGLHFTGEHVKEVLEGTAITVYGEGQEGFFTVPGIPVNGFEPADPDLSGYSADFSHLELVGSMMSHQNYRNWNVFMEAELAVLQDIGVKLDRRDFYGRSIYASGTPSERNIVINSNPFYARKDGNWIIGLPNDNDWGIGLHVYGSYNDVYQRSELKSSGKYGIGIRVDGVSNNIFVDKDAHIAFTGANETGIAVVYGKNHNITVSGNVEAGANALQFDFGNNMIGNGTDYRGSYLVQSEGNFAEMDNDSNVYTAGMIDGALVDSVNLSGSVTGGKNAIYIGPGALVKTINVMNGASLSGNITSDYDINRGYAAYLFYRNSQNDSSNADSVENFLTQLNFGLKASADGTATQESDSAFSLVYTGTISAPHTMDVNVRGGRVSLNGTVDVHSVTIDKGAQLAGNATYNLHALSIDPQGLSQHVDENALIVPLAAGTGTMTNSGTVSPGNSIGTIAINGNYTQTADGMLKMEFSGDANDELIVTGTAALSGSLEVSPLKGGYFSAGTQVIGLTDLVRATTLSVSDLSDSVCLDTIADSPVISMTASAIGEGTDRAYVIETAKNYTQYASNANETSLAGSLAAASAGDARVRSLISAIDFSDPSGREVRTALSQLTPRLHANAALGSFDYQHNLSQWLTDRRDEDFRWAEPGQPRIFAAPFLMRFSRDEYRAHNAGALFGINTREKNFSWGVHGAFGNRNLKQSGDATAHARTVTAGIHAVSGLLENHALEIHGSIRGGFDRGKTSRKMAFGNYRSSAKDTYTAMTADLSAGVGYRLDLGAASVTPYADLEYSLYRQPTVRESGSGAALKLQSKNLQSLRATTGLKAQSAGLRLEDGSTLKASGHLALNRELLSHPGSFRASLAHDDISWSHRAQYQGRNSVSMGLSVQRETKTLKAGVHAGVESYLGGNGTNAYLKASLNWRF